MDFFKRRKTRENNVSEQWSLFKDKQKKNHLTLVMNAFEAIENLFRKCANDLRVTVADPRVLVLQIISTNIFCHYVNTKRTIKSSGFVFSKDYR